MKRFCGDCAYFDVDPHPPDPPLYFCNSAVTKQLEHPVGHLPGADAPACPHFVPVGSLSNSDGSNLRRVSLPELFLTRPDLFIDVKTAAFLLRKSPNTIYSMVQEGRLDALRIVGTIHIYRPSLFRAIQLDDGA